MKKWGSALVALLLLTASPRAAGTNWLRVETPNFIVYGNAGERAVRDVASDFERFREAMGRLLPGALTRTAVPTVVVVFDTRRAYEPYRPMFNGKRIDLGGAFLAMEDENLVTLTIEDRAQALRTIFHEYSHLITANVTHEMPAWASEGLAEYYSTFELTANGREATLGQIILPHLQRLNDDRLLTLAELLGVRHDSPMYNEGSRRSVFYAESWALVHMLVAGEPNRSAEFAKYLQAAATGASAEAAWHDAFGAYDPIGDLRRYVSRNSFRARLYKFDEKVDRLQEPAIKVSTAEAEAALCDILRRTDGLDAAGERLEKAAGLDPPSPRARALLGVIRIEQQRDDEARTHLMAVASTEDWFVQYRVASGLRRLIEFGEASSPIELVAAARRALETVLTARPELPHALAMQAEIGRATRTDLPKALAAIRRARTLAPGRDSYAFIEAHIQTELGQFSAARDVLGPMMSPAFPPQTRDHARTLMANVVRAEQASARQQARSGERAAAEAGDRGTAEAGDRGAAQAERPADNRVLVPEYRPVGAGEQRTEGTLERIECIRDGVVLHVRSGDRTLRFHARALDAIQFLTYRDDLKGSVACGPRTPPDRVYVTSLAAAATALAARGPDGQAVAVEFLPK